MGRYLLKRILYAFPILLGVNLITFVLFFMVNSPDDIARMHLGRKYITTADLQAWKQQHGYNQPLWINHHQSGLKEVTDTLFFTKTIELFTFKFGFSDQGRNISDDVYQRMWPSLALAVPTLLLGLFVNITLALLVILFRGSYFDILIMTSCVILMSISILFYIIFGQYLFAKVLQWVPLSGYAGGWSAAKFLLLPILVGVVSGIGAGTRWYRTLFLEELYKDYVRTARAKGLGELTVLFKHILKNALIPILTGVVVLIPLLFLGSLLMESFFAIPGLGSYTIEAIAGQDFNIVRVMVFLGTLFYILGLILTDFTYVLVDPRVKLSATSD